MQIIIKNTQKIILILVSVSAFFITSCRPNSQVTEFNTNTEMAQQVGDAMSSVDESAGSSGSFAWLKEVSAAQKSIAQTEGNKGKSLFSKIIPEANAVSCFSYGFTSCTSNAITRTFNNCALGAATFSGTVVLSFAGPTAATCKLSTASDAVTRNPNFTISAGTGTISIAKAGTNGQTMTYVSGSTTNKVFSLTSDGIRRTVTIDGTLKHDVTTSTTSAITVTGSDRVNRVMNGGTFRLQNNISGERCDISPSVVTWSGTCTCATSGHWSGTCETKGAFNLAITGCGTATLTIGSETTDVTLNRCSGS